MEKSMKKGIASRVWALALAVLVIAIVLSGLAFVRTDVTAGAEPEITQTISVDNLTVHRGQEFDVNISLSGNEGGLFSLRLEITFDKSALTLIGHRRGKTKDGYVLLGATDYLSANVENGYDAYGDGEHPFVMLWNASDRMIGNGKIVTLTFRSEKDAYIEDREVGEIYTIAVKTDKNNTRVKQGEPCDIPVSGGDIRTLYGANYVLLHNTDLDEHDPFVLLENNDEPVTIEQAEATRPGEHPSIPADGKFEYVFRGWQALPGNTAEHMVFVPTFDSIPVNYTITFHQGIQVGDTISYVDSKIQTFVGADYAYGPENPVVFPYGSIIVFDDYKPEEDFGVHPDRAAYTFFGWFEDIFCETPVSFLTMPDLSPETGIDLYGYYKMNVEEDLTTATELAVKTSVKDGFVYATICVEKNFGVNSFAFSPVFNGDVLSFEGFLLHSKCFLDPEKDAPFLSLGDFVFPIVNAATAAGEAEIDVWQNVASGYNVSALRFGFISSENTVQTGEVLTLKFSVKHGAPAGVYSIGMTSALTDSTRVKQGGTLWYTPVFSTSGNFEIKRIAEPVAKDKEYFFNGDDQAFEFDPELDETFVSITNPKRRLAGVYDGEDSVVVSLRSLDNVFMTWANEGETVNPIAFPFEIQKRRVSIPTETVLTYVYTGEPLDYVFESAGDPYYEITNGSRTNAGTYEGEDRVFVTLSDLANNVWANGESDPIGFVFTINKQPVIRPVINAKGYNGQTQTATVSASELYAVTANEGGIEMGFYPVEITLNPEYVDNYKWVDSDEATIVVMFEITEVANAWTVTPYVADKYYDGREIQTNEAKALFGGNAVVSFRNRAVLGDEFSEDFRPVNAGLYTAKFYIPGTESYSPITETIDFEIFKAQVTVPTATERTYVYNGQPQKYEFANAGDTETYNVANATRTEVGLYTGNDSVVVSLSDPDNTVWKDGTSGDKSYAFEIRALTLNASAESAVGEGTFDASLTNVLGFAHDERFAIASVVGSKADLTAMIAGKDIVAAEGQTPNLTTIAKKCVFAALDFSLSKAGVAVAEFAGTYLIEITLPEVERSGFAVATIDGDDLVVFDAVTVGENKITFSADELGRFFILADHAYTEEIVSEETLKSAADCENAAVYYKSCPCGDISAEDTFVSGDPLDHDLDFANAVWTWANDRSAASATVPCLRDETHRINFDATVEITGHQVPGKESSGFVEYTASILYKGETYKDVVRDLIPSTGHVFSSEPSWTWTEDKTTYKVVATFVCDCGESVRAEEATVTPTVGAAKLRYDAVVVFNGAEYKDFLEIDRPAAIFDFADGVTREQSIPMLPGEKVTFPDAPDRDNFEFLAWKGNDGSYIVKNDLGEYIDYSIGFKSVVFTALWKAYGRVEVLVKDEAGAVVTNATVALYNGDDPVTSVVSGADGSAVFSKIPFGNYKVVVQKLYKDGEKTIVRSSYVDLDKSDPEPILVVLPIVRFNTVVEGDGSSEGLDKAISEEEKSKISDETTDGAINEIIITQKRVSGVSDAIKEEFAAKLLADAIFGKLIDFYDVTIVMTITQRNSLGVEFVRQENITVADRFQTNVFPISAALRTEIARVSGTVENIFVYKRHTYDTGTVVLFNLPKVPEEEGENAMEECFFIKRVGGVEYIAIRQREYSSFGFGVAADPVLYANDITKLALDDWTFGSDAKNVEATAKFGTANIEITYSDREDGEFTSEKPSRAGRYFVKAYVPASATYASAERITSFTIAKKVVERPAADTRTFVYNGAAQVYGISSTDEYTVTGGTQTNAGVYEVVLTLADADSVVWDSGISDPLKYEFKIEKKKLSSVQGLSFEGKKYYFDWKRHSIYISGELPEGITVNYNIHDEYEIGKYIVTATFVSTDPNYDVSEPMTAVMYIRMNWLFIIILLAIVVVMFVTVFIVVELLVKKMKKQQSAGGAGGQEKGEDNAKEEEKNE